MRCNPLAGARTGQRSRAQTRNYSPDLKRPKTRQPEIVLSTLEESHDGVNGRTEAAAGSTQCRFIYDRRLLLRKSPSGTRRTIAINQLRRLNKAPSSCCFTAAYWIVTSGWLNRWPRQRTLRSRSGWPPSAQPSHDRGANDCPLPGSLPKEPFDTARRL